MSKEILSESINTYKDYIGDDVWPIQVLQEDISCALDIPLRIYNYDKAKLFWSKTCHKNNDFFRKFPDLNKFNQYATQVAKDPGNGIKLLAADTLLWSQILTEDERSYWLTSQSHPHPLCLAFYQHEIWCWWEFFWFYYNLVIIKQNIDEQGCGELSYGFYGKHLNVAFTPIQHRKGNLLVAGPSWKVTERANGAAFDTKRVNPMVNGFLSALQNVGKKSLYDKARLNRSGNSRYPLETSDLLDRLIEASITLNSILSAEIPRKSEIRRCDLVGFAEWTLFTVRLAKTTLSYMALPEADFNIAFRLDHSLKPGQPKAESSWVHTRWLKDETGQLIPNHILQHQPPNWEASMGKTQPRVLSYLGNTHRNQQEILSDISIGKQLGRFLSEVSTRKDFVRLESLFTLRGLLNDRFGVLTAVSSKEAEKTVERESKKLCRWAAGFLSADVVTLYQYKYDQQALCTIGLYHGTDKYRDWEKKVPKYMERSGSDFLLRQQSICYRAIDSVEVHSSRFTRFFNEKNGVAVPEDEPLLSPPDGLHSATSVIASPITVYGRPWGILEVSGFHPYQFRWDNRRFTEELAELLSTFYYHQFLLTRLHELNKVFSDNNMSLDAKYDALCHNISDIFLSTGASIWLLEPEQEDRFQCMGCHNRDSLKERIRDGNDKLSMYLHRHSTLSQVLKKIGGDIWWHGTIGEGILDSNWISQAHNSDLNKQGIQYLTIIPIRDESDIGVMATVSLYNKDSNKFDDRWENLVSLVTRHLRLLLSALRDQQDWERRARSVISHEMKSQVGNIQDRAINISHLYSECPNIKADKKDRMDILIEDLHTYSGDLNRTLSILTREDFKKLLLQGADPLFALAQGEIEQAPAEKLNLRKQFNYAFRSTWSIQKDKGLKIHYSGPPQYKGPYIWMQAKHLREILDNLCKNTLKYSLHHQTIRAEITESTYILRFRLSNYGACLKSNNTARLFQDGVQGDNAVAENDGEGRGLFLVRGLCELYGIQIKYNIENIANNKNHCIHIITLEFPMRIIEKDKGH